MCRTSVIAGTDPPDGETESYGWIFTALQSDRIISVAASAICCGGGVESTAVQVKVIADSDRVNA